VNAKTVRVEGERGGYTVYLGRGLLKDDQLWRRYLGAGKTLVVTNDVVAPLYLEPLRGALGSAGLDVHIVPDGEHYKTVDTWRGIIDRLVALQARRDATIVALGGGVVGDMAGFAAASYMRGIRFIQAPTTLLAQVDASVGGKTGVNHARGKNLIGAFHQPAAVIIDSDTLSTLPEREYAAGLAEVVKYGAIGDSGFFDWLWSQASGIVGREADAVAHLVGESVRNKAAIVARDEKEAGIRALLNFGHTFGHALESESGYRRFLHGEAVSIGMVTAAGLSEQRGLCRAGTASRLASLLTRFGLPVGIPPDLSVQSLADAMQLDKKAVASGLRLVLLEDIGRAVLDSNSDPEQILQAMSRNQNEA
jgi:3-dehydroquinate synthase